MLIACGCVILIGAAWITRRFGSLPVFNQLVLAPRFEGGESPANATKTTDKPPLPAHPLVSVGDWGRTDSPLRPAGRVRFAGRSLDVISDGNFVDAGRNVRVISIQGSVITVVAVPDDDGSRA
jgi:membrane-bound serine protease (ClpP class)